MAWLGSVLICPRSGILSDGHPVSLIVGNSLVAPISSGCALHFDGPYGLAAGAATAGCCALMVGFAVASFRENKGNGLVSQVSARENPVPEHHAPSADPDPSLVASAVTGPGLGRAVQNDEQLLSVPVGLLRMVGQIMSTRIGYDNALRLVVLLGSLSCCFGFPPRLLSCIES
jgi:uncharacterized membrane protein